ncbi:amidase signature enzyme [Marasmius fiardii PR-910]|nr:amidase signature enzyme [Marasmius fiardii PR-910]
MRVASFPLRRCLSTSFSNPRSAIYDKNSSVNAFVHIHDPPPDVGVETFSQSASTKPLRWTTVAVKDNICTSDMPTTCSSAMLKGFISPFDATVVKLLKNAGADIVGKTNCDEFGMGSLNTHSIHGPVINPFQTSNAEGSIISWRNREKRVAGGSSGGSAAAVAADMCDIALATDTGGSIRLPASYCGVVGLKPSYGLVSRWGVVSYADSLDCVGLMAKSIFQVRRAFDVLDVPDSNDPTSVSKRLRETAAGVLREFSPFKRPSPFEDSQLRVGVPKEYFAKELSPAIHKSVRRALRALKDLGAQIVPVSLPSTSYGLSAYYVLASAEASSNLARYDGVEYGLRVPPPVGTDLTKASKVYSHTRTQGFGDEVRKRILLGTYALTAGAFDNYFLQAQKVRQLVRNDFDRIFRWPNLRTAEGRSSPSLSTEGVDVLIHPSAIRTAPLLTREPVSATNGDSADPLDTYLQDVLTVPASLAGLPALNIPVSTTQEGNVSTDTGDDDGWPVGVSIVGQWGCDRLIMDLGMVLEAAVLSRSSDTRHPES